MREEEQRIGDGAGGEHSVSLQQVIVISPCSVNFIALSMRLNITWLTLLHHIVIALQDIVPPLHSFLGIMAQPKKVFD
jgi:hypothetical protein